MVLLHYPHVEIKRTRVSIFLGGILPILEYVYAIYITLNFVEVDLDLRDLIV